MFPDRICLTGMMGAGKTTVGRKLAEKLGYLFIDLDAIIEEFNQQPVQTAGEAAGPREEDFEKWYLDRYLNMSRAVFALDAASLQDPDYFDVFVDQTWSVYLHATSGTLFKRLAMDESRALLAGLPSGLKGERLRTLLLSRHAEYERAGHRIQVDHHSPELIVSEIIQKLMPKQPVAGDQPTERN